MTKKNNTTNNKRPDLGRRNFMMNTSMAGAGLALASFSSMSAFGVMSCQL